MNTVYDGDNDDLSEVNIELSFFNNFVAQYESLNRLGLAMIPLLSRLARPSNKELIDFVVKGIAENTFLVQDRKPICHYCFNPFTSFDIDLFNHKKVKVLGCSYHFQSVAYVPDTKETQLIVDREYISGICDVVVDVLQINWLYFKEKFVFDRIVIGRATQEDIERLMIWLSDNSLNSKKINCTINGPVNMEADRILRKYLKV